MNIQPLFSLAPLIGPAIGLFLAAKRGDTVSVILIGGLIMRRAWTIYFG